MRQNRFLFFVFWGFFLDFCSKTVLFFPVQRQVVSFAKKKSAILTYLSVYTFVKMSRPQKRKNHETGDSESEEDVSVCKKAAKDRKRRQCFIKAYSEKWDCLSKKMGRPQAKGREFVFCTVCKTSFSCAHGGRHDCQKHINSVTHQKLAKGSKGNQSIAAAFSAQSSKSSEDLSLQVTNAEVLMCRGMVAEGNVSMSLAERFVPLMKRMFPDSRIADGMQVGCTKATVMLKEMSALAMKELAGQMKARPFSIAIDGSNEGEKKQFPLVIRSFSKADDGNLEPVTTQLLALRNCEGSATGKKIFEVVDTELQTQGVSWDNCIAFGSDNAPVMTDQNKGVLCH